MSYTDLLESKHHYLTMLKDADASRRAIERDFTSDKANEYNKIMAIRNTAFINLIKEDVPYIEDDNKECLRIEIDGNNYDMKKSKLKMLVGDEIYERILARSHEHAETLSNLKDNGTDIPEYQLSQSHGQQQLMQQPYGYGQQMLPYGYMPQQAPYPAPYGYGQQYVPSFYGQPYIPPQDNSQVYAAIGELTDKLNKITENIKPETQVKEVVIDDQIREQLKLSREELEQAKKDKSEAIEQAHDALENLEEAKNAMEAERTKQQILSGDVESLKEQKEQLERKLDNAKRTEEEEKNKYTQKIQALNNEKQQLISKHASEIEQIKSQSTAEITKRKQEISQARDNAFKQANERMAKVISNKDAEIKRAEEKLAQKDIEYKQKIAEANQKIKDIMSNADVDTKNIRSANDRRVKELTDTLNSTIAERDKLKADYAEKYNIVNQKISEANQRAKEAEENLAKQTTLSAAEKAKTKADIEKAMNERIADIKERAKVQIGDLENKLRQKEANLNSQIAEIEAAKKKYAQDINEIKQKANSRAAEIQEELNKSLSQNEEYKVKIQEINKKSQSMVESLNNQIKEQEAEFTKKEAALKEQAEHEKEVALKKLQEEFEQKQREMEERHKEELDNKKAELDAAKETIENSKEQIENLNEAVAVHSQLAYYDKLTGLMNNNKLSKDFKEMTMPTFAMICINDMKSLNAQNKAIGDNAIKFIGNKLKENVSEYTYRSMGDIFAVMTDDSIDVVKEKLESLKNGLSSQNGLYIAYGVVSCEECEHNEMPKTARDRMNTMREQNRVIIKKLKDEAMQREEMRRQYEETKQRNASSNSLIDIQEVQSDNGRIITRDISADETYYETLLETNSRKPSTQNGSQTVSDDFGDEDDDIYENL